MTRPPLAEALRLRELAKIGAYEEHRRMMCEHADGYWDGNAYHSSEADTCPHHDCVLVRAFSSVEASPQVDETGQRIEQHLSAIKGSPDWADLAELLDWYKRDVGLLLAERRGLQERIKFTADYESLKAAPALRGEASPLTFEDMRTFAADYLVQDCDLDDLAAFGLEVLRRHTAARVPVVSEDSK